MMNHSTNSRLTPVLVAALFVALSAALLLTNIQSPTVLAQAAQQAPTTMTPTTFDSTIFILSPAVRPEGFVACVDNPYFPLIPGTVYVYELETDEGLETTTVTVTDQIKMVMGIAATVVRDTVVLDGELKEDTLDWFAQDKRGNVWYLGEATAEYENGEVVTTEGSWEAGVDGAVPGIIMLADPMVGDIYRQEYLEGEATDMGAVLSLNESVSVPFGDFDHVLMTADYNPLSSELEHKFYAAGVGTIATASADGSDRTELISVSEDPSRQADNSACSDGDNDD